MYITIVKATICLAKIVLYVSWVFNPIASLSYNFCRGSKRRDSRIIQTIRALRFEQMCPHHSVSDSSHDDYIYNKYITNKYGSIWPTFSFNWLYKIDAKKIYLSNNLIHRSEIYLL